MNMKGEGVVETDRVGAGVSQVRTCGQIRNPKSEIRNKSEARTPNGHSLPTASAARFSPIRVKAFRISDFRFRSLPARAFSLLEVMIAMTIFFVAMFSILALVGQSLRGARMLSRNVPTPGMAIAQLSLTNKLEEGSESGDFGDLYAGYDWTAETTLASSNGLFQIDVTVFNRGNPDSSMSVYLYRPDSATGLSTRSRFR